MGITCNKNNDIYSTLLTLFLFGVCLYLFLSTVNSSLIRILDSRFKLYTIFDNKFNISITYIYINNPRYK